MTVLRKRHSWPWLAALLWSALSSAPALAQSRDHLECYRAEDRGDTQAVVDIETLSLGLHPGCIVQGQVREVCTPIAAEVLGPLDASSQPAEQLASERLCYRIKCPQTALPPMQASDRFGTRTLVFRKSMRLCTAVSTAGGR